MKILALLSIIFSLVSLSGFSQEEKMKWNKGKLLNWKDFRGTPSKSQDFVASTNSGISLGFSSKTSNGVSTYSIAIDSYFYPDRSWFRPGIVDDYILKHEQTHFDISEIYARLLRKKLAVLDQLDPAYKLKVEQIYNHNEKERAAFQSDFDRETSHSKNPEEERVWEQKVTNLLKELDAWK